MARPRWQRLTITAVKSDGDARGALGRGRHVLRTWNDLRDQSRSLHFEPGWLIGSGLLYLAGLVACGRFLRADPAIQSDAGPAGAGAASLPGEPPG